MAEPEFLDDAELGTWRSLLVVATRLLEVLDRELQQHHGLSLSEYEVLFLLSEAPRGRLRMAELAGRALVTRSRLTHTVDRLARAGLVRREPCPTDRRGSFAVLTRSGRQALARAARTHIAGVRQHFLEPLGRFSPGESDPRLAVAAALNRVAVELSDIR